MITFVEQHDDYQHLHLIPETDEEQEVLVDYLQRTGYIWFIILHPYHPARTCYRLGFFDIAPTARREFQDMIFQALYAPSQVEKDF